MDKLGIGLISCGIMGTSLARELVQLDNARLVAVCDPVEDACKKLLGDLKQDIPWHLEHRELVERKDVDAVLVAAPGFLHRPLACDAFAAGKHVFSEKPLAVTLEDCDAMIAAASEARKKLMVGQVCRYHAAHRKVRELALGGDLGRPIVLSVHRLGGGWGGVWRKGWRLELAKCGGNLMEVNAHEIDWIRWVCGEAASVQAIGGNYVNPQQDYPDVAQVLIRFKNGACGYLHSSGASVLGGYGGRLDCERGSVVFPEFWGRAGITWKKAGEGQTAAHIPAEQLANPEPPVRQELRAFVNAVLTDTEPPITGRDGRANTEIALAAYASIRTGKPVGLPVKA